MYWNVSFTQSTSFRESLSSKIWNNQQHIWHIVNFMIRIFFEISQSWSCWNSCSENIHSNVFFWLKTYLLHSTLKENFWSHKALTQQRILYESSRTEARLTVYAAVRVLVNVLWQWVCWQSGSVLILPRTRLKLLRRAPHLTIQLRRVTYGNSNTVNVLRKLIYRSSARVARWR